MKEEEAIIRINDITEEKLIHDKLIQSEKLASLGLLISGIAHEINNPNNFITFNLPILRDYANELIPIIDDYANRHPGYELFSMPYPEFRRDFFKLLENVEHGAARINATISKLREFSRMRGQQKLDWVNLKEVIERAVTLCQGELKKKVRCFELGVPDNLPPVFTDPEAVEQVIVNLLINAVQAVDKERSRVSLKIIEGKKPKGLLTIEVKDDGIGIDDETLKKIFDPFFTTKQPGTGTGLGLYVSRDLIEGLRGNIEVESKPGEGSTFRVMLPSKNSQGKKKGVLTSNDKPK